MFLLLNSRTLVKFVLLTEQNKCSVQVTCHIFIFILGLKSLILHKLKNILNSPLKLNKYRSSRPEMFCKKGVLRHFAKFNGKHLCQGLFINKVAGLTLLKKRLWHRCFPVNFAKFLRPPFLTEHL